MIRLGRGPTIDPSLPRGLLLLFASFEHRLSSLPVGPCVCYFTREKLWLHLDSVAPYGNGEQVTRAAFVLVMPLMDGLARHYASQILRNRWFDYDVRGSVSQ